MASLADAFNLPDCDKIKTNIVQEVKSEFLGSYIQYGTRNSYNTYVRDQPVSKNSCGTSNLSEYKSWNMK